MLWQPHSEIEHIYIGEVNDCESQVAPWQLSKSNY